MMTIDLTGAGLSTYYGQVDAGENFNFYTTAGLTGSPVGTILSPFNSANQTAGPPTIQVLANSGVFAAGNNVIGAIANRVVGALNRGTFGTNSQPVYSIPQWYPGTTYQNQYAMALHAVANQPAYGIGGGAYAFGFDDSCATSTDAAQTSPTSLTITINPS